MTRLCWLLLCVLPWAQQPAPASNPAGVISGRITDGASGTPLPHAVVRLIDGTGQFVTTTTDGEGRYAFPGLPAGRYRIVAQPGEFVATHVDRMYEGERTAPNNIIVLERDRQRTDIDVALPRAYAIAGTVLDAEGEPAARIMVEAQQVGGAERVNRNTDDRGEFRIFGLPPGEYVVCARPDTVVHARRARDRSRPRLVETCSPSAPSAAEAAVVTIKASDAEGVDVRLLASRTFSISGAVVDTVGGPASGASVSLTRFEPHGSSSTGGASVDAAGRFVFRRLIPGEYAIRAVVGDASRAFGVNVDEIGYARVSIGNGDVDGVLVTMAKTVDLRGQITLAEGGAAPAGLSRSINLLARLEASGSTSMDAAVYGTVNPDLTFDLRGLFGKRLVTVTEPANDWIVKAIRYRGRDILDVATELAATADARDLEIVLTNRGAVVSGVVSDAAGRPANARVVMVPADRSRWATLQGAASTMFVGIGQFRLGPIRPGEYAIVAIAGSDPVPDLQGPSFFERVLEAGQAITLTENDRRTVDLRISKLPEGR